MPFFPLHIYTGFSYLKSGLTPYKAVVLAKKNGYDRIGISDYASMSGFAPFFHESKKYGLKPFFGMDIKMELGTYSLFVRTEEGYRNLCEIEFKNSSSSLDEAFLNLHKKGLIAILPLEQSFLKEETSIDSTEINRAKLLKSLEGFDDHYLGIPFLPADSIFVSKCRTFANKYSYKTIAYPSICYSKKEDGIVKEIVNAIASHSTLDHESLDGFEYFLSKEGAEKYYGEKELSSLDEFSSSIDFDYLAKRGTLLKYPLDINLDSRTYLRQLSLEGLKRKKPDFDKTYTDRLDYELSIIDKMGYNDYFLIVQDYVKWAKDNGISVGPGRGSAGGSLVSYALDIVTIDPIQYGLLFERFLNPDRQSMPDIDVDFADIHRDRVVDYLQKKYGKERVSHVLTSQTIGAKEALRDTQRVFNFKMSQVELILKTISDDRLTLVENYKQNQRFQNLIKSDPYYLKIVTLASKIEGLPRQAGIHAAGVILNDDPLFSKVPVTDDQSNGFVTCLEKDYLEEQGFLKMDILGLTNLTTIDECVALIKEKEGIEINPAEIPYDDPQSIQLIKNNMTMGLFQLESAGMKRTIDMVKPSSFSDVAALIALFRPGPMQSIPSFAKRKRGQEAITYPDPSLEEVLKETYGIIVYQEQVMQIVRIMAGFSFAEADLFRRAISKKDAQKLESLKKSFINGCLKNGKPYNLANKIFDLIERFANYGFNKSHAISYAAIACQMAYLKAHYPKEFYCVILSSLRPGDKKFKDTLSEVKALNLQLAVPDINRSNIIFEIDGSKLLFPLNSIKGIQNSFVLSLLDDRGLNGEFKDIFDFSARMSKQGLNLSTLVRMIDSGCFDSWNPSRATLREAASSIIEYGEMASSFSNDGLLGDFGLSKPLIEEVRDDPLINLEAEEEALGMMVSSSPMALHKEAIASIGAHKLSEIGSMRGNITTVCIIKSVHLHKTKTGRQMAFVGCYDEDSEAEFVAFPETYDKYYLSLQANSIVVIRCHRDQRNDGKASYIIDSVEPLKE